VVTANGFQGIFDKVTEVLQNDVGNFVDEDIFLATTALESLALICANQTSLIPLAVESVKLFVTRPSKVFTERKRLAEEKVVALQQIAVVSLCRIMEADSAAHGDELKKSTMYSLSNTLYTLRSDQGGVTKLVAQNCIAILGGIAVRFRTRAQVVETALSILVRRYGHLDPNLEVFIIEQVIAIGQTENRDILKEIFDLCAAIIKASFSAHKDDDKGKTRREGVLKGLHQIAKNLSNLVEIHEEYLLLLVNLFISLVPTMFLDSNGVPNKDDSAFVGSAELASLVQLLPIIGELMNHTNFNPQTTSSNMIISTFRLLWLYITLLGIGADSAVTTAKDPSKQILENMATWSKALNSEVVHVALKTPPITAGTAANYFDSELDAVALIKAYTQSKSEVFQRYEHRLREKVTELLSASEAKVMPFTRSLYLYSVYQLEIRRLIDSHGSIQHIFAYLSSEGISTSSLSHPIEKILDNVVASYIAALKTRARNLEREVEIEDQAQILAVLCCHQVKKVGAHAKKYLEDFIAAFPQLLWSSRFLTSLLDVAGVLVESCGLEPGDLMPRITCSSRLGAFEVVLAESLSYRQELMQTFVGLGERWLKQAASQSPKELVARLQEFLAQTKKGAIDNVDQYGASLASQIGSASFTKDASFGPHDPRENFNSNGSAFIRDMLIKNRHAGEVGGMELNLGGVDPKGELSRGFLKDLAHLITLAKRDPASITEPLLKKALFRATSLLISTDAVDFDLLYSIVWTPMRIFTPLSLRVGTAAWSWIVAARPEVDLRLMTEIISAWDWSIRAQVGLFTLAGRDRQNILYSKMKYSPPSPLEKPNSDLQEENAHLVVISWLSDRLKVVSLKSQEHIKIYMKMLSKALDNATFSVRTSARAALFKLLSLGMHVSARVFPSHLWSPRLTLFSPNIFSPPADPGQSSQRRAKDLLPQGEDLPGCPDLVHSGNWLDRRQHQVSDGRNQDRCGVLRAPAL